MFSQPARFYWGQMEFKEEEHTMADTDPEHSRREREGERQREREKETEGERDMT